jgi:hypothetical protein
MQNRRQLAVDLSDLGTRIGEEVADRGKHELRSRRVSMQEPCRRAPDVPAAINPQSDFLGQQLHQTIKLAGADCLHKPAEELTMLIGRGGEARALVKFFMGRVAAQFFEELKYFVEHDRPHPRKLKAQQKAFQPRPGPRGSHR